MYRFLLCSPALGALLALQLAVPASSQETLTWVSGGDNSFGLVDGQLVAMSNIACGPGTATATFSDPNGAANAPFPDARGTDEALFRMNASGVGQVTRLTLMFSVVVDNLTFTLFDVDMNSWGDDAQIAATNGGVGTNVNLACSDPDGTCSWTAVNNNTPTATASGNADNPTFSDINGQVTVTIAGPVDQIVLDYIAAGPSTPNQFMATSGYAFDCITLPVTLGGVRVEGRR